MSRSAESRTPKGTDYSSATAIELEVRAPLSTGDFKMQDRTEKYVRTAKLSLHWTTYPSRPFSIIAGG